MRRCAAQRPIGGVRARGLHHPDRQARRPTGRSRWDVDHARRGRGRGRRRSRARLHLYRRSDRRADRGQAAPTAIGGARRARHCRRAGARCSAACAISAAPGLAATAISAVDAALWDLKAKLLELPLATLLGRAATRCRSTAAAASPPIATTSCASSSPAGSSATAAAGSR